MASRFQRFLLPGFAFKAVVIGGGYATGRELAEFFVPSGPWGGIAAILLAILTGCMFLAQHFGLVALIAKGYRALAAIFLLVYVLPLLTLGLARLRHGRSIQQSVSSS